jgi:hypothetical protein
LRALRIAVSLTLLTALSSSARLRAQGSAQPASVFRNTDSSVAYVGSKTCTVSGCHEEIGRSYPETPMGHSMAPANSPAELARVAQPVTFFNEKNNRTYQVYQEGGNLYQCVYEVDKKGRKTNYAAHKMDWVVGSALTGYSYLFSIGAWIFQAPLSYYSHTGAEAGKWELSPGYPVDDIGFTRRITTSCMHCHNGQPDPVARRDGMYKEPPFRFGELAIGCEACHGPGQLHVREMLAGRGRVLVPNEVDTSIVNPARLSPRLADDLCRSCHQAGDAVVLRPGKDVLDYRPGTPLSDTMVFLKRQLKEDQRGEANRLETETPVRGSLEQPLWWKNSSLELSKCYQASHGRLSCITCHSVHHTVKPEEQADWFRGRCLTCHKGDSCKLAAGDAARVKAGDNCIDCHMEKRSVAGIAHSSDTKHRIVRFAGQPLPEVAFEKPKPDLPGLVWLNRPAGDGEPLAARSQLEAYWTVARKDSSLWPYWFRKLEELSKTAPDDPLVLSYLGAVALSQKKDNAKAADYFSRALKLGSVEPTTFLDLATALANLGRGQEAEAVLERGVAAYPYSGPLIARLAQQYGADGQSWRAHTVAQQYRKLFPEDLLVREALKQLDGQGGVGDSSAAARGTSVSVPK